MKKSIKMKDKQLQSNYDAYWDKIMIDDDEAVKEAKILSKYAVPSFDSDLNLKKFIRELMPKIRKGEKLDDKENKLLNEVSFIQGIETGRSMMESVEERYRGMMYNFRKQLVQEYNCITDSEKALVDMVVSAYARNLSITKMLVHTATKGHTTPGINTFLSIMSKEVDRANRHFVTALEMLRSFKQPELKVNIKAKNAFISQNQLFNNKQNETNESK